MGASRQIQQVGHLFNTQSVSFDFLRRAMVYWVQSPTMAITMEGEP